MSDFLGRKIDEAILHCRHHRYCRDFDIFDNRLPPTDEGVDPGIREAIADSIADLRKTMEELEGLE